MQTLNSLLRQLPKTSGPSMSTTFLWRPCLVQAAARTQNLATYDIYSLRVMEQWCLTNE